jgi:hypothetical protein
VSATTGSWIVRRVRNYGEEIAALRSQ